MISTKKSLQIARILCKKCCFPEGFIQPDKIHLVLKELTRQKPAGFTNILKALRRQVAMAQAKEEVMVEAAQIPPNWKQLEKTLIERTAAKRVLYKPNPDIVFGAKITHGDWIWDETLDNKLEQLTNIN